MEYEILQAGSAAALTEEINKFAKDGWHVVEHKCIIYESNYKSMEYWSALMARENPPPKPEGAIKWTLLNGVTIHLAPDDVVFIAELAEYQQRNPDLTLAGATHLMNAHYGQQKE